MEAEEGAGVISAIGGVVTGKKDLQQVLKADDTRVEADTHHFGMAGVTCADGFIGGRRVLAIAVPGFSLDHTLQLIENRFEAPETPPCQGGFLKGVG